jgi:hypothetical protein
VQREFLGIVIEHHKIAVLADQIFFIGFDLHLRLLWLLR